MAEKINTSPDIPTDDDIWRFLSTLPQQPSKDAVSSFIRRLPPDIQRDVIQAFVKTMMDKKGQNPSVMDLVKVLTLLPEEIWWYREVGDFFANEYLEDLKNNLLRLKFDKQINLGGSFKNAYGLTFIFKPEFRKNVYARFPYLKNFIEAIIADDINIYFINSLIIRDDGGIGIHLDGSIGKFDPKNFSCPERVSVLYIDVPEMSGGELRLFQKAGKFEKAAGGQLGLQELTGAHRSTQPFTLMASIQPVKNKLVHFRGNLLHEVTPVIKTRQDDKRLRISLVCEQYNINPENLYKYPDFEIQKS